MKKDVIVSISGLQYEGDDSNPVPVEVLSPADYYFRNDAHYVMYDEISEDFDGTTHNRIKLRKDLVEITKKGLTTVTMKFETGKKNQTYYQTPFGSILVGILTNELHLEEDEDSTLRVAISYELEIDSQPLADCHVNIKIMPKEAARLS